MGGTPATSGTVTAAPCTSDTWLYEGDPSGAYGGGTAFEADLYVQRSTTTTRARTVIQWDLVASVIPTVASGVVVSNASITLFDKSGLGTGTIEIRCYNWNTTVEAQVWADGAGLLKDGQASPAAVSWAYTSSGGLVTIPSSAGLNALIQEGIRNHGSVVSLVLQYTADNTVGALTSRFAALEDAANQEPRLSFDWLVQATGGSNGIGDRGGAAGRVQRVCRV